MSSNNSNNSNTGSVISEKDLLESFNNSLFSTSPCVFHDIHEMINTLDMFDLDMLENKRNEVKNKFKLVLKDILIFNLKNEVAKEKKMRFKYLFDTVIREILIFSLKRDVEKYKLGYTVYMGLISGDPFFSEKC